MERQPYLSALVILFLLVLAAGCSTSEKDWQKAEKLNTIEAYEAFLQKHPQGQLADSARQEIEELEWRRTVSLGTVEAYEAFLQKHSQGQLADSARQEIEELEWQKTMNVGTVEAYEAFLRGHPQSTLGTTARLNRDVLNIVVNKIDSFFIYEGSEVLIMYEPSGEVIQLKYINGKWQVLKSEVSEVKRGRVMIIGKAQAGARIGAGATAGEGGVELAINKEL